MEQRIDGGISSSRKAPGAFSPERVPAPALSASTGLNQTSLARTIEIESQSKLDQISGKILTGLAYGWSAVNSVAVSACILSAGIIGMSRLADKLDRNSSFIENFFRQAGSVALVAGAVGGLCAFVAKKFLRSEEKTDATTKPDENNVRKQLTDFATHAGVGITATFGTLAAMRAIELINPASGLLDNLSRIPMESAAVTFTISLGFLIISTGLSDNVSALMGKLEKLFERKK